MKSINISAENFRGFREIFVDLGQTTFIVGDNSSGKSAILHLIEFVLNNEWLDNPSLCAEAGSDPYDFFSPYFDDADVVISVVAEDEEGSFGRAITLSKGAAGEPPIVKRTTFLSKAGSISIRSGSKEHSAAVGSGDVEVSLKTLLQRHRSKRGFKIKIEGNSRVNQMGNYFLAINEIEDKEKMRELLVDVMRGLSLPFVRHIGPIRAAPERFYNFERRYESKGSHFAAMWLDMKKPQKARARDLVKKFGEESGLFDDIDVKSVSSKIDKAPMVVTIMRGGKEFYIDQVGVGVSQVAPIIVETLFQRGYEKESVLLMQQPELHLHPIAQAALGEFFYDAKADKNSYIMETHSDFLIDRYRYRVRESNSAQDQCGAILFCENTPSGNKMTKIDIRSDGRLDGVPGHYKEFFVKETVRTMF